MTARNGSRAAEAVRFEASGVRIQDAFVGCGSKWLRVHACGRPIGVSGPWFSGEFCLS